MVAVDCKLEIPQIQGLTDNEMTVGREAILHCEGDFPKNIQSEKLHLIQTPEQKYQVKLLRAHFQSPTKLDLKVTSYMAGEIRMPELVLSDDVESFSVGSLNYQVVSVLPKPEAAKAGTEQKQPEPYGPIGPASLAIPLTYWLVVGVVVVALISLVIYSAIRRIQRRNMIARLKEHDSALAPLNQFHQSLRRMQRSNPVFFGGNISPEEIHSAIQEMQSMLQLFITRKYQIPAMEWGTRLVLKDLRKHHRKVYQAASTDLRSLLNEYEGALANKDGILSADLINLAKRTRTLVERMESLT